MIPKNILAGSKIIALPQAAVCATSVTRTRTNILAWRKPSSVFLKFRLPGPPGWVPIVTGTPSKRGRNVPHRKFSRGYEMSRWFFEGSKFFGGSERARLFWWFSLRWYVPHRIFSRSSEKADCFFEGSKFFGGSERARLFLVIQFTAIRFCKRDVSGLEIFRSFRKGPIFLDDTVILFFLFPYKLIRSYIYFFLETIYHTVTTTINEKLKPVDFSSRPKFFSGTMADSESVGPGSAGFSYRQHWRLLKTANFWGR